MARGGSPSSWRLATSLAAIRRVGRLMAQMGLVAIQPRSFKPRTTDSRHTLGYSPNLLIDAPPPDGINQLWVGDITYIPLVGGDFLYWFLYGGDADGSFFASHRRLGFAGSSAGNPGNYGLAGRDSSTPPQAGLDSSHPSRRRAPSRSEGRASVDYREILARAGMPQSMSRAADCYDNALMESCFGTLKTELEMKPYENEHIARKEVPAYIRYYNTRRRHSALGYLTPEAFEARARC